VLHQSQFETDREAELEEERAIGSINEVILSFFQG
jgi:hypothetical protein